jgi:hypothetical protein
MFVNMVPDSIIYIDISAQTNILSEPACVNT